MKGEKINVVKILLQNGEGRFLVVQKTNDKNNFMSGKWELPGGKIEPDESKQEAAGREVREETGLEIENLEKVVRVEVEDRRCVNCWIYYSDNISGNIDLSEEHIKFEWVSASDFKDMDWHRDAGYAIPAMRYLSDYLSDVN